MKEGSVYGFSLISLSERVRGTESERVGDEGVEEVQKEKGRG